ncbi:hypothetical protein [Clostridium niameyense]|uniref:hypothetical protein n=1 Tax=Clostridium niameyense TaxID=1622073 RepID=UPI00067EC889|nr:hypothetical protein [Clostridium niameyense]
MKKAKYIILLIILIICSLSVGCMKIDKLNGENISTPNNNLIPIEGTWKIEIYSCLDSNLKDNNLNQWKNKYAIFNKDNIVLGDEVCENPQYKIKKVNSDQYFLYRLRINPGNINIKNKEIEIISVSSDDKPFYDFAKISNEQLLINLENCILSLKKVSKDTNINKDNFINKDKSKSSGKTKKNKEEVLRSGVLLGLKSVEEDEEYPFKSKTNYRTLWISSTNKSLNPVIEVSNLFLPRKTGFCELGLSRQTLEKNDCDVLFTKFYSNTSPKDNFTTISTDKDIYRNILFVSNDYISTEYTKTNKSSEGRFYKLKVIAIDNISVDMGVKISEVAGITGKKSLESSTESYLLSKGKEEVNKLSKNSKEQDFFLDRRNGHWIMKGRLYGIHDKKIYRDFNINFPIPKKLLNYDELQISWNSIKSKVPDAVDAYTSPNKDLALIITNGKIYIYTIENDRLSNKPIYNIDIKNEKVVMAEWAMGDYVEKWKEAITKNKEVKFINKH